jgi:HEPN domain-containing protein
LPPDDPLAWIERARSNLVRMGHIDPDALLEDYCFGAQQAAEKAIKAVFVHRGETFPYTHDLLRLLLLLESNGQKVPKYVKAVEDLTQYAHVTRYPGIIKVVTQREFRRAARIATTVLRWAERPVETP